MKVLLVSDVERLGWLGDVVEVNDGYARNYLLPQGLGVAPTEGSVKAIAEEKAKRAGQRIKEKTRQEEVAKAVESAEAVIAAVANEQGHLFGSVTAGQIAANLREQGFDVADSVVQLSEHIKEVGTYSVNLKFAADLTVSASVVVVAAGEDVSASATPDQEPAVENEEQQSLDED